MCGDVAEWDRASFDVDDGFILTGSESFFGTSDGVALRLSNWAHGRNPARDRGVFVNDEVSAREFGWRHCVQYVRAVSYV